MILSDLSLTELKAWVKEQGLPEFRGKQIYDAIIQGKTLEEITTISNSIKKQIEEFYPKYRIFRKYISADGTIKYVYKFDDGNIVEGVLMKYKYGNTLCISTQVGCRMGCKFCASTLHGLIRNLSTGEILGQAFLVNRDIGGDSKERKITNIVLMGSGEPLDNYLNVTKFIKLINSEDSLNISERNISLSTCGLVDKIYALADDGFKITLTISLHASNDEVRRVSMPIAQRYTIKEIIDACKYYFNKTGRRIIFEYTLIKDVNDKLLHAEELANLLKGFSCHVNIIPLNKVKERKFVDATRKECYLFAQELEKFSISATVRRTMGDDIGGACGQLRNQILMEE